MKPAVTIVDALIRVRHRLRLPLFAFFEDGVELSQSTYAIAVSAGSIRRAWATDWGSKPRSRLAVNQNFN